MLARIGGEAGAAAPAPAAPARSPTPEPARGGAEPTPAAAPRARPSRAARAAAAPAAAGVGERHVVRLAGRRADRRRARHRPVAGARHRRRRPRHEEGHPGVHRGRAARLARGRVARRPRRQLAAPSAAPAAPPTPAGSRRRPRRRPRSRRRRPQAGTGETFEPMSRDAARDRRAHAPVARHLGARHERDRGRHVEGRRDPREAEEGVRSGLRRQPDLPRVHRARDGRDAARLPVGERRDSRRQDRHARASSTSASRSSSPTARA